MLKLAGKIIILALMLTAVGLFARAQTTTTPLTTLRPVLLSASPSLPEPGEQITIKAVLHKDIIASSSEFVWFINEATTTLGVGKKEIKITAGEAGIPIRVRLQIKQGGVLVGNASLTLIPLLSAGIPTPSLTPSTSAKLTLLWSAADSYVPPWYKGKPLAAPDTTIRVIALPKFTANGRTVSPRQLNYQWSLDYEAMALKSGMGEDVFHFQMPVSPQSTHVVRVRVWDPGSPAETEASLTIRSQNPKLLLYEVSPLGGPETSRAINSLSAPINGSVDVTAVPFFVAKAARAVSLVSWSLDGRPAESNPASPYSLTISAGAAVRAQTIGVTIKNFLNRSLELKQFIPLNVE